MSAMTTPLLRRLLRAAPVALVLLAPAPARPASDGAAEPVPVRVERVRPRPEKRPTLRFLKANRDFLSARFERLRERPVPSGGDAAGIDPRFLAYQRLLAEARASADSLAAAEREREGHALFASVTELGGLESELDLMDRLLAAQRARLDTLQSDFAGRQRTALFVVVSGWPAGGAVERLTVRLEDSTTVSVPLDADEQTALRQGGWLEVFHGLVEPRPQVLELAVGGAGWPAGDAGWVSLEPARDRLTFLRLDLSEAEPAAGASTVAATTWLHDASLPASPEPGSAP
jgi:hypothetical protein